MKPLKEEVLGDFSLKQHRDCLIMMAKEINGCCVKFKDGTYHQVTLDSNDEIKIESYEPWYEFENENELKSYIRLTNEDLDNFIRWQALEIILNEKEEDPFEKE